MNILFATSEVAPLSKTGGLADVCGALPQALAAAGEEVAIITPAYRCVRRSGVPLEKTGVHFDIPIGSKLVPGELLKTKLPGSDVTVYLVEQEDYYDRAELYWEKGADYRDNCERFIFFCRAAIEAVQLLDLPVDILHCHDWQTGLIPAYLRIEYKHTRGYEKMATVLTVHNLAYQGQFWHWDMLLTGLDWKYFNWRQMEFYGHLNLLKTGIVFADALTTVSPRYAQEIQTPEFGHGLHDVVGQRRDVLQGITNGIDHKVWDPQTDPHLPQNYGPADAPAGKAAGKAALQQEFNLPVRSDVPLISFIGRLAVQKGIDITTEVLTHWLAEVDAQWVILGVGDPVYQDRLSELARRFPDKLSVVLSFDEGRAHRIEAGADMVIMPSQYEPCGLTQLYSMRYGTAPIVRATGGLADTVVDATPENLSAGTATGFHFTTYSASALDGALHRACALYGREADHWRKLITTGMQQDWSWSRSAAAYASLYARTSAHVRERKIVAGARP